MKLTKKKKGFTLIELLVVIAIIGILAGIVLVSLSGAQKRAKDGRIMAEMGQLRSAAEVWYGNNNNSYLGFCTDSTTTVPIQTDIGVQGGTSWQCTSSAAVYCAEIKLNSGGYYCVDSTLKSLATSTDPACATAGDAGACGL